MDHAKFLEAMKKIINDPAVDVAYTSRDTRPGTPVAKLDSEAFRVLEENVRKKYKAPTLPTMGTGARTVSEVSR